MAKSDQTTKKNQDIKPRFQNTWWMYFMILFVVLGQLYILNWDNREETDWHTFKTTMLANNDIKKLDIVNKESVEVYIKAEALDKEQYTRFSKNNSGPHYFFDIGSIDAFEQKLEAAQNEYASIDPVRIEYSKRTNWLSEIAGWIFPIFIFIALWMFVINRAMMPGAKGGRSVFDFGKTSARVLDARKGNKVRFDDVAGLESAKAEVKEIVTFLKEPENYTRLGAKIPTGVMLVGPPGTGKTLLAKAVAGEADVPFFSMSGSEFVEMFVGVGASRVRDLFKRAKTKAPSIIFIDEIDAIGKTRGKVNAFQSNDERETTLNQLLTEMDGFGDNPGVIVLAATNRPDVLDKALLRPGRFDRHIYLELPNLTERLAIFKVHTKRLLLGNNIDLEQLAAQTPGFSGADIANICNEAALIAARTKKEAIEKEDFDNAIDRIIGGLERKGKIISPEEKKIIAYHEAGHATVSWFLEHTDELIKVTIVPRGKSLGAAWYQIEEHHIYTTAQLKDKMCSALGGRAAESLIFDEISSGALDDLEKVTKQAYAMVSLYGFSNELGHLSFHDSTGSYERSLHKPYSETTATLIDQEVQKLIESAYLKAIDVLTNHKEELIELAELLLKKEVVHKAELENIFSSKRAKVSVAKPV